MEKLREKLNNFSNKAHSLPRFDGFMQNFRYENMTQLQKPTSKLVAIPSVGNAFENKAHNVDMKPPDPDAYMIPYMQCMKSDVTSIAINAANDIDSNDSDDEKHEMYSSNDTAFGNMSEQLSLSATDGGRRQSGDCSSLSDKKHQEGSDRLPNEIRLKIPNLTGKLDLENKKWTILAILLSNMGMSPHQISPS